MDLRKAKTVATELIEKHLPNGWEIRFSNVTSKVHGRCRSYRSGKPGRITFYRDATLQSDKAEFTDTVLHEIAHALAPWRVKHGYEWKRIFINLGGSGRRYGNFNVIISKGWEAKCRRCNSVYTRIKAPLRGRTYSCCYGHTLIWTRIGEQVSIAAKTEKSDKKSQFNHLNCRATGFIDSKLDVTKSLILQGYNICKEWNQNHDKQIRVKYIVNHCKHLVKEHGVKIIW